MCCCLQGNAVLLWEMTCGLGCAEALHDMPRPIKGVAGIVDYAAGNFCHSVQQMHIGTPALRVAVAYQQCYECTCHSNAGLQAKCDIAWPDICHVCFMSQ